MPAATPAAAHARTCAVFTSGHDRATGGKPGRFRPVPCDCHADA